MAQDVIKTTMDASAQTLTFEVKGARTLVLRMGRMSVENRAFAALHGMKQRIADAAAIPFALNGRYATPHEKADAMAELIEFYEEGGNEWKRVGTASPKVSSDGVLAIRAIAELYGRGVRDQREMLVNIAKRREMTLTAYVEGIMTTARAANGVGPFGRLPAIYERLKSEQPVSSVKVAPEDMLAELGELPEPEGAGGSEDEDDEREDLTHYNDERDDQQP